MGENRRKAIPMAESKTNAMRILEQHKIPYAAHAYPHGKEAVDGVTVAHLLGQDPAQVFKTLIARGKGGGVYVFVIPVQDELHLKKAARAVGEKAIEMIHVREILGLTGYVRGGCSPIGLKKAYPAVFHESAPALPTIMVSAGRIGLQIEAAPSALIALTAATTADLIL